MQKLEAPDESKININVLSSAKLAFYKQEVIKEIQKVNLQPILAIEMFQEIFKTFLGKISSDLVSDSEKHELEKESPGRILEESRFF